MKPANQDTHDLVVRAETLYEQKLKATMEAAHRDKFLAIEPNSGDCFLGRTMSEAGQAARRAHPNCRAFVLRIGHRAAIHIGNLDQ